MNKKEFALPIMPKKTFKKKCSICNNNFETHRKYQNICSWQCRQIAVKERARVTMRRKRYGKVKYKPCEICGYKDVTDIHHERAKVYRLCPNHHALITRGIKTIEQLLKERSVNKMCKT